jgi:hypothetical protein
MSICGAITTRHVLRHAAVIVQQFGLTVFLRCCLVIVRRRKTTFLECVFPQPRLVLRPTMSISA